MHIIYKTGPDLFAADWLSKQSYTKNKNKEITCMKININVISLSTDTPICMSIQGIQEAKENDADIQQLKECIIKG